jgi:hypothetical protein
MYTLRMHRSLTFTNFALALIGLLLTFHLALDLFRPKPVRAGTGKYRVIGIPKDGRIFANNIVAAACRGNDCFYVAEDFTGE